MASASAVAPPLPDDLKNDRRDVADLWKEALKSYKGIVGFDLERKFDNVQSMIDQGTKDMNNFHRFRHNEKKVDKLRSLFAANLDYLEKGAQQLISAAVPAFPPAAAIGTALTYLLSACRQVSADYDIVVVFFEDMNSFLQRIVILETRLPKYKAYHNCLMDVFTSFLTMCGFAHKYIELGRFKKWISNLMQGEDSDLGGARKNMDKTLARLQNATEFAILGNTEELQMMSAELQRNQQSHTEMLKEQKQVMNAIQDTAENIRSDMAKLLKAFDEQRKDRSKEQKIKPSATEPNKPASAKRIRNSIPEVEDENHEYQVLKETLVGSTCSWVFSEPEWEAWLGEKHPRSLLAISGQPGVGKSHISTVLYDHLATKAWEDTEKRTCATHFYFREQHQSLSSFISAISTIINQIVEQSAPLCEMINNEFMRDENDIDIWSWQDLVRSLLAPVFQKGSKNQLLVVLDALDELEEFSDFTEFLEIIKEDELQISIVFTTRPDTVPLVSEVSPVLEIHVTDQKQLSDMKTLIWDRLNTLPSLRKFGRYVQQRIADKVEEAAPNMLYAEHMLLRFNSLGREGSVLRNLDNPLPADLHSLYETLLEECHRRTASKRQLLVTKLLHWVAFCYRPLVLDEIVSLLKYLTSDPDFDIEEIPEPFNKFIRVGDPGTDAEARAKIQSHDNTIVVEDLERNPDSASQDLIYDDGGLPVKFQERSMRSFFQEASKAREPKSLRWGASKAHRQIFLVAAELAQPDTETPGTDLIIDNRLKEYATEYLVYHWWEINPAEHSVAENAEVMQAFGNALLNQTNYVSMLEKIGPNYGEDFTDETFQKVCQWARLLESEGDALRTHLSDSVAEWWAGLDQNPRRCLLELTKGHTRELYSNLEIKDALVSFRAIRKTLHLGRLNDLLVDNARRNFPISLGDVEEGQRLNEKQASLALVDLFDDVKMDATAYFSVASVMFHFKRRNAAEATCDKALEVCNEPVQRIRILDLKAQIQLKRNKTDEAYQTINDCIALLDSDGVSADMKRWATITKARIEVEREESEAAALSYARARLMDPDNLTPGDVLEEELEIFENEQKARHIGTLKEWSGLERLTWMAWNYDDYGADRHAVLRDIAVETGEKEFVEEMYEEAIRYLDNVGSGAPLRCDLALFYVQVYEDIEKARKVLHEVLDSSSTGWAYAITEQIPEIILEKALNSQTDILSRLFKRSCNPVVKKQLLEEAKNLTTRPLALDVPPQSHTYLLQRQIMLARMYLKIGPAEEFQNTVQEIIDVCIEGLRDKVGWNDSSNLVSLASALMILGKAIPNGDKILRASEVLFSSKFSRLSPEVRDDDSEDGGDDGESAVVDGDDNNDENLGGDGDQDEGDDGNEDGDDGGDDDDDSDGEYGTDDDISSDEGEEEGNDDGSNNGDDGEDGTGGDDEGQGAADEGDLDIGRNVEVACNGRCNPATMFWGWEGRVAYECTTCFGGFLCEPCYEARQADNRGEVPLKGRQYCGRNHEYLNGPIEGWRGVKDGKLMIEGEEPVDFEEFLRQIKDELVKEAWETFWEG